MTLDHSCLSSLAEFLARARPAPPWPWSVTGSLLSAAAARGLLPQPLVRAKLCQAWVHGAAAAWRQVLIGVRRRGVVGRTLFAFICWSTAEDVILGWRDRPVRGRRVGSIRGLDGRHGFARRGSPDGPAHAHGKGEEPKNSSAQLRRAALERAGRRARKSACFLPSLSSLGGEEVGGS